MKKIVYILWLIFFSLRIHSQKLNVQVSTTKPIVGVPFEIAFSINANIQDFTPPPFTNFQIVSGPNQSQSISFVNGNLSQSISISYVLVPLREGACVINAAKVVVNGQSIYSSPITLDVQKNTSNNNNNNNSFNRNNEPPSAGAINVSKDDIFVKTFVNKKQCYIGEQIILTQKIYTKVELRGIQNVKFPHLEGFWSKNQETTGNIPMHIENIDGVNYYVGEISKQYLFPQKSGKLTISPIEIDALVRKRSNRPPRDVFEQFFGVNAYEDKIVSLKSQPISITIDDLPSNNKPSEFSGAVGSNFSFKAEISKNKIPANDALTLKLTISGTGNIPLIDAPKINFPPEFETYDPKVTENINSNNNLSGTKTYEYLIIPRKEGIYKLSDIHFSYFNLNTKSYANINAPDIVIEVSPSLNKNNNAAEVYQQFKQEIKNEDNDIHYIKLYPYPISMQNQTLFNSSTHISLMLLPYLAMLFIFGFYQYQKNQRSDWSAYQQKTAQKRALKHLAIAEKKLKENNSQEFYTAIIQSLENYTMQRFKINKSQLSKDKVKNTLQQKNIPEHLQNEYFNILNTCEIAKYTPAATENSLLEIFNKTKNLIIQIENHIKNA